MGLHISIIIYRAEKVLTVRTGGVGSIGGNETPVTIKKRETSSEESAIHVAEVSELLGNRRDHRLGLIVQSMGSRTSPVSLLSSDLK